VRVGGCSRLRSWIQAHFTSGGSLALHFASISHCLQVMLAMYQTFTPHVCSGLFGGAPQKWVVYPAQYRLGFSCSRADMRVLTAAAWQLRCTVCCCSVACFCTLVFLLYAYKTECVTHRLVNPVWLMVASEGYGIALAAQHCARVPCSQQQQQRKETSRLSCCA
jgi:hypothetical protein